MQASEIKKKVKLQLVGLDVNAFAIMGAFQKAARRDGWTKEEIDAVLTECMSGDYNHLLATVMSFTNNPLGDDDEEGDDE